MSKGSSLFDSLRARARGSLDRLPGKVGERLRELNEALGRPLADAEELADRRAFERGVAAPICAAAPDAAGSAATAGVGEAAAAVATPGGVTAGKTAAPVIVYHLDKHKGQLARLTQTLDAGDIPYRVLSLEGDPATQSAVRRDSNGRKLPLVFIAGECVGGREELHALERSGALAKKVWG
jgi:glutaredoxin 3